MWHNVFETKENFFKLFVGYAGRACDAYIKYKKRKFKFDYKLCPILFVNMTRVVCPADTTCADYLFAKLHLSTNLLMCKQIILVHFFLLKFSLKALGNIFFNIL